MAVEAPARPSSQVDQDKLLALLKEYAERVRLMADRLDQLRFRAQLSASATVVCCGMLFLWLLAAAASANGTDSGGAGQSSEFEAIGLGFLLGALAGASLWRHYSRGLGATERNLEVYSRQLRKIAQRTSELQDDPAFEQLDAHLELELAMLDAESSIRFAESAMR